MSAGEGAVMRKQMIENAAYEVATQVRTVEDSIEGALALILEEHQDWNLLVRPHHLPLA